MDLSNPNRPTCPDCGEEMVFLATRIGPDVHNCFVSDCKNEFLSLEIRDCREDVSPDASIVMKIDSYAEEEQMPQITPDKMQYVLEFYCPN
jgi:hypothetical protein